MPNLSASDLTDPHPPVAGDRERALVAARAQQLGRRRRLLQTGGALAVVVVLAVSVAALTTGGTSQPGGAARVEAATAGDSTPPVGSPAPGTFSVSGTVNGAPADTTVTVTFHGDASEVTATADDAGNFTVSGLPVGDYQVTGEWVDSSGTATRAERFGTVTVHDDSSVNFTFSH
jgi:hypothetical protein